MHLVPFQLKASSVNPSSVASPSVETQFAAVTDEVSTFIAGYYL